jgi:Flp pilus assembly protein TadG
MINKRLQLQRIRRRGGAIVETALGFGLMLWIVCTILQWALVLNAILTVQYYARESARYAAVHNGDTGFGNATLLTFITNKLAPNSTVQASDLTVAWYPALPGTVVSGVTTSNYAITVSVTYNVAKKVVFAPWISGLPSSWLYKYNYTTFSEGD